MIFVLKINFIFVGPVLMSSGYAVSFIYVFAAIPALIIHAILYHGSVFDLFSFYKKKKIIY
jgi:hypothetical protein